MPRRRLPSREFNPLVPFTRAEAVAAGISDDELAGPWYQQVFWGVHLAAGVAPTLQLRSLAALTICPAGALITHHTAARLWGGIAPDSSDIHVTVPRIHRPKVVGIRPHRVVAMPPKVTRRGLPATSVERTFLDLGRWCNLVELVVLGDSLVRAGVTTPDTLVAAAEEWRGSYRSLVRRAASLVRDRVDSPMESRLRMLLVLAGLPEPVVNFEVVTAEGRVKYRIDLSFPEHKLGIEFDGRHHIERQEQWEGDLVRREDLEADDWKFVIVVGSQVYGDPAAILDRVVTAMRSRGIRTAPRLSPEWHRHFPGRATS
jgi:very-short-patch-repair endonuclease